MTVSQRSKRWCGDSSRALRSQAVGPFKSSLVADGIPYKTFEVETLIKNTIFIRKGVGLQPMDLGAVKVAVFDDTCGNLIQLTELNENA